MTQQEALSILKMGHNVFLTGAAGSGKTHTLRNFISFLTESNISVAITASTGIAATHLGGMTIHAWSGLGIRNFLSEKDIDDLEERQYLWKRYNDTKVLVIDEVSMLHHFRFDLLDKLCRSFKRKDEPFGGMQIVLCGDFFQLPPVSRQGEDPAYFIYKSKVWNEMGLKVCYLSEQHRQSDRAFLSVLNSIRNNTVDEETLEHLRSRYKKKPVCAVPPTKLSSHNENVDVVNNQELSKIRGAEKVYMMESRGSKNIVETLKKSCLAPEKLVVRVGARVMFVKNNFEQGYVNGTLGVVEGFDAFGNPKVLTAAGKVLIVEPASWKIEEDGKTKAEITQLPLRLAWAITVHKSQGMSLDAAEIDLSKSFVPGMGYVALSRVRSLEGLNLLGFNSVALQIHPEVLEIDQTFKERSEECQSLLEDLGVKGVTARHAEFLRKNTQPKTKTEKDLPAHHKTKILIQEKISLEKIAEERGVKVETIIDHIEKLLDEKEKIDIEYLKKEKFTPVRFDKIKKAFDLSFKKNGDWILGPVKNALGAGFSYAELRLARLFIKE